MDLESLPALLPGCETSGSLSGRITGLSYNSKTTEPGDLFFCLPGNRADGHLFAPEAVENGALALVVEHFLGLPIGQLRVADSREAFSRVGRSFFGDPAARLGLVGVTGTNGKTTTAFMIRSVLEQLGESVGIIGTVHNQLAGLPEPSAHTTPESADLWRLLARAVEERCRWVVMEVSSHALAMRRVDPADFDLAVVTNISRDHFDFHRTFEHYFESKARLARGMNPVLKDGRPKAVILNAGDPRVMEMACQIEVPQVTFGIDQPADVAAGGLEPGPAGTRFELSLAGTSPSQVYLPLPGRFNVANALAAAAVGWVAGVPAAGIVAGLEAVYQVPGRAEIIDEGQDFLVLVDFAHNPDALAKAVTLAVPRPGGRRILVFGAEGGKDAGKRPEMGAAARGADYAIITSDNMHDEDPADVAGQIARGLGDHPHEIVLDRRRAIERALSLAVTGDLVIIAGKGHEQTWVFGGEHHRFDDRSVAREILWHLVNSPRS